MIQLSENYLSFGQSPLISQSKISGPSLSVGFGVPKIDTAIDHLHLHSEQSPVSFSGRTSQNGDSDIEDLSMFNLDSLNLGEKSFFRLSSQSEGIEESIDSRSISSISLESSLRRPNTTINSIQDRTQAQMFLQRRLMQEQAVQQLLTEDFLSASTQQRVIPSHYHQIPQPGPAQTPRPVAINQFNTSRQVNNAPTIPRAMQQVNHLHNAQPSVSALRFQQQMQQHMQSQAAETMTMQVPGAPETLGNGDFVVVEADRGEDVGVVTEVMTMKTFVDRRILTKASNNDEEDSAIGKILRPATLIERQTLAEKFRTEEIILLLSRELAYKTYQLPLQIHNVEYQFDRHKLTVYYSSEGRVDFREFVRDLYAAYKARIWMKKIDVTRPMDFQQSASIALATGMQPAVDMCALQQMPHSGPPQSAHSNSSFFHHPQLQLQQQMQQQMQQRFQQQPQQRPMIQHSILSGSSSSRQPTQAALSTLRGANHKYVF